MGREGRRGDTQEGKKGRKEGETETHTEGEIDGEREAEKGEKGREEETETGGKGMERSGQRKIKVGLKRTKSAIRLYTKTHQKFVYM